MCPLTVDGPATAVAGPVPVDTTGEVFIDIVGFV